MIIQNGIIQVKEKTVSGIDPDTGYPIKATNPKWGEPIPCQYTANKYNNLGKTSTGEPFTVAQYEILVDLQPLEGEQIRLIRLDGKVVGEFSVMEAEELEAVCELRLLV